MKDMHFVELGRIVRDIDFFQDMSIGNIDNVCRRISMIKYDAKDRIFREGDLGDCFNIIYSGLVQVSARRGVLRTGALLALLKPPQFFGEMALVSSRPRNASAVAIEPTILFSLERTAFEFLIEQNPHFHSAIDRIVARRKKDRSLKLHRDL